MSPQAVGNGMVSGRGLRDDRQDPEDEERHEGDLQAPHGELDGDEAARMERRFCDHAHETHDGHFRLRPPRRFVPFRRDLMVGSRHGTTRSAGDEVA